MRIKSWMTVKTSNYHKTNNQDAQYQLDKGYEDIISVKHPDRKIKSLKRSRKVARFWNRHKPHKTERELLNEMYRFYRPGSRAESCGLGNFWMGGVEIHICETTSRVFDIYVKDQTGKRGCDILGGGGCVSHGKWYETVYHATESELNTYMNDGLYYPKVIGNLITSEFGIRLDIEGHGPIKMEYSNKWPRTQSL